MLSRTFTRNGGERSRKLPYILPPARLRVTHVYSHISAMGSASTAAKSTSANTEIYFSRRILVIRLKRWHVCYDVHTYMHTKTKLIAFELLWRMMAQRVCHIRTENVYTWVCVCVCVFWRVEVNSQHNLRFNGGARNVDKEGETAVSMRSGAFCLTNRK